MNNGDLKKDNDWVKIFTTPDQFKAQFINGMLEEHNIKSVIMNKKDSAYGVFGEVEVYVLREDVLKAMNLINNQEK